MPLRTYGEGGLSNDPMRVCAGCEDADADAGSDERSHVHMGWLGIQPYVGMGMAQGGAEMAGVMEIRGVRLGEGVPKVIVPLVGRTKDEVLQQARRLHGAPFDMIEWRGDWFEGIFDKDKRMDLLSMLRRLVQDVPVLFTFRSSREGGERDISAEEYSSLLADAGESGLVDLVDVEAYFPEADVDGLIERLHGQGVKVIASFHDFEKTPSREEMLRRLFGMHGLSADIIKLAVMPRDAGDVLALLAATEEMTRKHAIKPVIAMSMGRLGMISRICGETFGIAATFGSLGTGSAPGQIAAGSLAQILEVLHDG